MNIFALELTRLPTTSLRLLLRLAKTLLRDRPVEDSNAIIDAAADALDEQISETERALLARHVAANPELSTSEKDFDFAVDGLWMLLNRLLDSQQAYAHAGLDMLSPPRAQAIDLPGLREQALQARRLQGLVFGARSMVEIVRTRYIEQVEAMAEVLRVIDEQDLRGELEPFIGPELLPVLEACQAQYEDMIHGRMTRAREAGVSLGDLRVELRLHIINYVSAAHSLFVPKQPETAERVLELLHPIVFLRELSARVGGAGPALEDRLEGFVELELPEVDEDQEQGDDVAQTG